MKKILLQFILFISRNIHFDKEFIIKKINDIDVDNDNKISLSELIEVILC